ncbi:MAG: zinc ribbon domain-containing protein [Oscillospiraceae bacterium]|nr:zinc ribbon domain-containing protein [Oscillospiraceae bacterium]
MICLNCGKHVDDDVRVCPFCGAQVETGENAPSETEAETDPMPINPPRREPKEEYFERVEREQPAEREAPVRTKSVLGLPALLLALASLVLSLLCLVSLFSLRGSIAELKEAQTKSLSAIDSSVKATNDRLDQLDATLAKVQTEAYEKVASQSISLVKDLTPLVGPVDEGKYNRMFIVTAKGNLNRDTSFDWQRYNAATGGWVSIVFTGDATTNEQFGLRLENQYDAALSEYTTILWANGITPEAAGTYRCVITDATGITKTSAEATVEITAAEAEG